MITKSQILQQKLIASTYPNRGLTFTKGEGSYLITERGNKYLDMMTNYGVNVLGYGNDEIADSIANQVRQLSSLNSSFNNPIRSNATKQLINAVHIDSLKRVFWSSSGTEAVEAALKFAAIHTKRSRFVSAKGSYHGKTLGSLSVTTAGENKYQKPFAGMLIGADYFEYGDAHDFRRIISDKHAAVILEPIQGEAGIVVPSSGFLEQVSSLCKKTGALLIIDEIQTGMGRTGSFLNIHQHRHVVPDMVCLAKGIGYGVPVGATILSEPINQSLTKGIHTSTFGGNPISLVAVSAVLEHISNSPSFYNRIQNTSVYLMNKLEKLKASSSEIICKIEGCGLMIGIETNLDPLIIIKALQKRNVLVAPTSLNRFRLLPPLTISKKEVDFFVERFTQVLEEVGHV